MTVKKILNMAISQLGTKEYPTNSNKVKYNTEYYGKVVSGSSYPWCCTFIWWLFKAVGASSLFYGGQKTAYCPTVESYYRQQKRWYSKGQAGDLVLFDFSKRGYAEHIGIVESVNPNGTYNTIEGNTGTGNNTNGGAVMRRVRYKSDIRGFARPKYSVDTFSFTETKVDYKGVVMSEFLNIRKLPTTDSEILSKHALGDIINITAKTNNGWYRVDYPHLGTGYISAQYVLIEDNTPKEEPQTIILDNTPNSWATEAVETAKQKGIIRGDSNGDLKLHSNCTREDMIVFLYRLHNDKYSL